MSVVFAQIRGCLLAAGSLALVAGCKRDPVVVPESGSDGTSASAEGGSGGTYGLSTSMDTYEKDGVVVFTTESRSTDDRNDVFSTIEFALLREAAREGDSIRIPENGVFMKIKFHGKNYYKWKVAEGKIVVSSSMDKTSMEFDIPMPIDSNK
jgi:hypothetical protein